MLLLTGCATTSPEQASHRERLSTAAQDCQRRYPFVMRVDFDRFDRLTWLYREGATQSDRDAFTECYRVRVQELTTAVSAHGSTGQPGGTPSAPSATADAGVAAVEVPVWKPGFEWEYRQESPRGRGTFKWTMTREETVDGTPCYVVWSGPLELYWRVSDLASVLSKRLAQVETRYAPPRLNLAWPLAVGRSWEQLLVQERPLERKSSNLLRTWQVERMESVTVPAGTFRAWKVVSRDKWANSVVWEYWYAPDVRNLVRSRETPSYGGETRELIRFKLGD
jgi:hypothetical protein